MKKFRSNGGHLTHEAEAVSLFWRMQVGAWLILAALGFLIRYVAYGSAAVALLLTLLLDTLGFALTSVAALVYGRHPGANRIQTAVSAALLCVGASALLALLGVEIQNALLPDAAPYALRNRVPMAFIYFLGVFCIWTLVYFAARAELQVRAERLQALRAQTRALQLELEHLHLQIEPHFLFNSLNTIVAEIHDRPAIAEEMTRRLAAYLRYSLSQRNNAICALRDELAAVETYLGIQALRFDDRFKYQLDIDPAALDMGIPHMTLQGLAENAIKHGKRDDDAPFRIHIRARRAADALTIEMDNPGRLERPFDPMHTGVGLNNLSQRLALHYPGRHRFSLEQRAERTVATLYIEGTSCFA
ncbi:sensor histidine kinase [Bordetella sp. LUAb4]|uniref:sensor histidine kinase n=1 Tax=Bordetella sp. LUAb4 TaxID=2843195 RepID=UPI001E42A6C0|nr:histidine kinase [Bordetella sp. LUAb4]